MYPYISDEKLNAACRAAADSLGIDVEVFPLGFGCMRFPEKGGKIQFFGILFVKITIRKIS